MECEGVGETALIGTIYRVNIIYRDRMICALTVVSSGGWVGPLKWKVKKKIPPFVVKMGISVRTR